MGKGNKDAWILLSLGSKYGVLCLIRRNYPTRQVEFFLLELFDMGERDRELNSIVRYYVAKGRDQKKYYGLRPEIAV